MIRARILGAAAFLLPFAVFLMTLCPTVHLGDSGELNLAASTLSIPHVPGYPLLVTVAHAVNKLPFGNGAYKGNLFSALSGSLACFLFYNLLLWRFRRPGMALAFALALAFGFTMWEQSLKIRAYPLNTAFAVGAIHLSLLWHKTMDRRFLIALGLLFGLGAANHEIILVVGLVPFVLFLSRIRQVRIVDLALASFFAVLGISVYAYLPIRAMTDPVLNWGDPDSLDRFIAVITQQQYSGKMLSSDWGPKIQMIKIILRSFLPETGPAVLPMAIVGIYFAAKKAPWLLVGMFLMVLANIGLRINYIGQDEFHQVLRYMISTYVALFILAAFTTDRLISFMETASWPKIMQRVFVSALLIAVAIPGFLAYKEKNNLSAHRIGYDYTHAYLGFPEADYAIAIGGDNNIFPMWYIQRFERYREDVVALPSIGFRADWLAKEIAARLPEGMTEPRKRYVDIPTDSRFYSTLDRLLKAGYPVYSLFDTTDSQWGAAAMQDLRERFGMAGCGMALRFGKLPEHCSPSTKLWDRYSMDGYFDYTLFRDHHTGTLLDNVQFVLVKRGIAYAQEKNLVEAVHAMKVASQVIPGDPYPEANLANILAKAGQPQRALGIYRALAERFPEDELFRHNIRIIEKVIAQKKKTKGDKE